MTRWPVGGDDISMMMPLLRTTSCGSQAMLTLVMDCCCDTRRHTSVKGSRTHSPHDTCLQATFRAKLGEGTSAFERITDGTRTVAKGSVVRINVKPLLVGRVLAFTIPQVRV